MDWTKTGYSWTVTVTVVHQTNVDNTLGVLSGVQLNGLTITENYYSDSRVQAKVSTVVKEGTSDGYVKNGRLRIILDIPSRGFSEELITGYVSDIKESSADGYTKRTYTIEGTIWGLLEHKVKDSVTIAKGAKLITVWTGLVSKQTKMQYTTSGAQDHNFTNVIVYEAGTSLSTILFDVSSGYDRMDVNGHGELTLTKYIAPKEQTATKVMDYHNNRGLMRKTLEKTTSEYDAPGRAIVTATISKEVKENGKKKTIQEVIVGSYDAPSTHATSIDTRGWLKGRTDVYNGTSETPSKSELDSVAKKKWEEAQDKGIEWSVPCIFEDWHAGEVVLLIPNETTSVKALIKSVTTNLDDMTQSVTLKEV